MKLISAVIASAAALVSVDWNGQHEFDPCGSQLQFEESSINKTCTLDFNGYTAWRIFLGGEWIIGDKQFTNYDGLTDGKEIDLVVFWEEEMGADGVLDNSTCGSVADITLNCVDQGAPVAGVYFQETANDYRMGKGSNYNIQIVGAVAGDTLSMVINNAAGDPMGLQNMTSHSGDFVVDGVNVIQDSWGNIYTDTGIIAFNVGAQVADVVHIDTVQQPGANWEPSFWLSTVTN